MYCDKVRPPAKRPHTQRACLVLGELDRLVGPSGGCSLPEIGHRVGIRQQLERGFEGLEILNGERHHARPPKLGDHPTTVLGFDPFADLGQTCLGIRQGDLLGPGVTMSRTTSLR